MNTQNIVLEIMWLRKLTFIILQNFFKNGCCLLHISLLSKFPLLHFQLHNSALFVAVRELVPFLLPHILSQGLNTKWNNHRRLRIKQYSHHQLKILQQNLIHVCAMEIILKKDFKNIIWHCKFVILSWIGCFDEDEKAQNNFPKTKKPNEFKCIMTSHHISNFAWLLHRQYSSHEMKATFM